MTAAFLERKITLAKLELIATSTFGLEAVVKREVEALGYKILQSENGKISFLGDERAVAKANLWLRCADRVQIKLAEFEAKTFTELFEQTKALPWEQWIPMDGQINVSGSSVKSQLHSVPACQGMVKKAIIEKLKETYFIEEFPETGLPFALKVTILKDRVTLTLDTTGEGLHKRGYRVAPVAAPIKETLAAAMVQLSFWKPGRLLVDPFCGSATIAIEAAMIERNIAPGLTRHFAMEQFGFFPAEDCAFIKKQCQEDFELKRVSGISGSDIDPEALKLAQRHVNQAGLSGRIELTNVPLQQLQLEGEPGVFLCNPPYGERLSDRKSCEKLYAEMGKLLKRHPGWSLCAITSDPMFERAFGRKADKKRRLYNGRLECEFLIYKSSYM